VGVLDSSLPESYPGTIFTWAILAGSDKDILDLALRYIMPIDVR